MTRGIWTLAALAVVMCVTGAAAEEDGGVITGEIVPMFDVQFQTYLYLANDRDFDRTEPIYSENGQTSGYVLTTLRPGLTWAPVDQVTVRYQLEVGDNIWSRNDLDGQDPLAPETAVVRHKEVWAEVRTQNEFFGVRSGFQYFYDPTHLVLDRHMGVASAFLAWSPAGRVTLAAGQVPDTVYEGLDATGEDRRMSDNNFEQDDYVVALWSRHGADEWSFSPGVFARWDKTEINRPRVVVSPVFHAEGCAGSPQVCLDFDAVGQWGRHEHAGLDNRDVNILAAAAQAGVAVNLWPLGLDTSVLAFTSDDGDKYDQYDTGFVYSGWSKSATMILTLNSLHDQYNNIDESVAAQGAGLVVADEEISVNVTDNVRLFAIIGAGSTLDGTNTDGEKFLGTEGHLGVECSVYENLATFHLSAGGLLPGRAAAMLRNEIDREATDPLGAIQSSMTVQF